MILIIDNGSQYTHLIKRTCRDLDFDCEVINSRENEEKLKLRSWKNGVTNIILSGGPGSVYSDPPNLSSSICTMIRQEHLSIPLLGICYGQQMIAHSFGATVAKGKSAEYGMSEISVDNEDRLFVGIAKKFRAWVSHFDEVKELPKGFIGLAHSDSCAIEAIKHEKLPVFGVQFHPEVWHTEQGELIIKNFLEVQP